MLNLKIGHYTNTVAGTGASIFLFDKPSLGAFHLAGSSPATFDLAVLDLAANTTHVDGLALLGGSVLGLPAIAGAQRWLIEQQRGWPVPHGRVPIVPGAAIYDLAFGQAVAPTPEGLYQACQAATAGQLTSGSIGAGTGATTGKLVPNTSPMKGGIGFADYQFANGVYVLACAVVNCVGDVLDDKGAIISGARYAHNAFANSAQYLATADSDAYASSLNTTLVALFTNAAFSKPELQRIAKMASAGMSAAISPVFTRYDGDIVFAFSLGDLPSNELIIGTIAVNVTKQAIINAVTQLPTS
jgi:L-aminopeptidase/D-esterase-like protein